MQLKLYTWNVNGIRAISKKGFLEWFQITQPDVLAVQETKADSDAMQKWWQSVNQESTNNQSINNDNNELGFESTNCHPELVLGSNSANIFANYELVWHSCSIKKGYSGTAIFYRKDKFPEAITQVGVGNSKFDDEGRTTILHTQHFSLINCYYPQGGRAERIPYKLEFYDEIISLTKQLKLDGKKVILCGDMNTTRTDIDLARPAQNRKTTGCLPDERTILENLINLGYVDSFRHFSPTTIDQYTYWDQITRARDRNVGWRIDYFLTDISLIPNAKSCNHLTDVFGSDHCAVELILDV